MMIDSSDEVVLVVVLVRSFPGAISLSSAFSNFFMLKVVGRLGG